jgi:hypothetical protein
MQFLHIKNKLKLDSNARAKRLEAVSRRPQPLRMKNVFGYFNLPTEIIPLTVMMYAQYPLSLLQVEDLLFERGIDICHEVVRL